MFPKPRSSVDQICIVGCCFVPVFNHCPVFYRRPPGIAPKTHQAENVKLQKFRCSSESFSPITMNDSKKNDNVPPNSRLFIVCGKTVEEEDFREAFSKFGEVKETHLDLFSIKPLFCRWRVFRSTRTGRAKARELLMSSSAKPQRQPSQLRR